MSRTGRRKAMLRTAVSALLGAGLGILGTFAMRAWLDARGERNAATAQEAPVARSAQWPSELAKHVRAFKLARGILGGAEYAPDTYVFVVSTGAEFDQRTHVTPEHEFRLHRAWVRRELIDDLSPGTDLFDRLSEVSYQRSFRAEASVGIPGVPSGEVHVIDLNGDGHKEVIVGLLHGQAVIDFERPVGEEILLDTRNLLWKGTARFVDLDHDAKYELVVSSDRWVVFRTPLPPDSPDFKADDRVFLLYRLDADVAEKERPAWVTRWTDRRSMALQGGKPPLQYHLGSVGSEDPAESSG